MYKTKNDLNPKYMKEIFSDCPSKYPSRIPHYFYIPLLNQIRYGGNSFGFKGPSLWNKLPTTTCQNV